MTINPIVFFFIWVVSAVLGKGWRHVDQRCWDRDDHDRYMRGSLLLGIVGGPLTLLTIVSGLIMIPIALVILRVAKWGDEGR